MSANPRSARQRFWGEAYREGVEAVDEGGRCGRSSLPEARFVAGNVGGGGAVAVHLRQRGREQEDEGGAMERKRFPLGRAAKFMGLGR